MTKPCYGECRRLLDDVARVTGLQRLLTGGVACVFLLYDAMKQQISGGAGDSHSKDREIQLLSSRVWAPLGQTFAYHTSICCRSPPPTDPRGRSEPGQMRDGTKEGREIKPRSEITAIDEGESSLQGWRRFQVCRVKGVPT